MAARASSASSGIAGKQVPEAKDKRLALARDRSAEPSSGPDKSAPRNAHEGRLPANTPQADRDLRAVVCTEHQGDGPSV